MNLEIVLTNMFVKIKTSFHDLSKSFFVYYIYEATSFILSFCSFIYLILILIKNKKQRILI